MHVKNLSKLTFDDPSTILKFSQIQDEKNRWKITKVRYTLESVENHESRVHIRNDGQSEIELGESKERRIKFPADITSFVVITKTHGGEIGN